MHNQGLFWNFDTSKNYHNYSLHIQGSKWLLREYQYFSLLINWVVRNQLIKLNKWEIHISTSTFAYYNVIVNLVIMLRDMLNIC